MKTVRLYGFCRDHGSYGQVTAGFREGLTALGYDALALDTLALDEDDTFDEEPTGMPLAEVAIFTGPPSMCHRMTEGTDHKARLVMIAPNSDKLPERMMHTVNTHATHLMAPSAWGKTVVSRYTELPVMVVPHGVSQRFKGPSATQIPTLEERYQTGGFSVLHLSSTDGERKGTLELCKAFADALKGGTLPPRAELRLVLTPSGKGRLLDEGVLTRSMTIVNRAISGASPEAMVQEYAGAHLVCQPSRGEGFGMVPLEALASGTPIAATKCTGHSEWFFGLAGAIEIATGPDAPIDDMPGAMAPSVTPDAIRIALQQAYYEWRILKGCAVDEAVMVRARRGWATALGPLRELLEI